MKMMLIVLLFAVCSAAPDHSDDSFEDKGEYGYYTTWRKAVCEKNDHDMNQEMDVCFKMEAKEMIDATVKCAEETVASSHGDLVSFMSDACSNIELFHKFDTCFEEYEATSGFQKMGELTPEIEGCYAKILEKYSMDALKGYLENFKE